MDGVRNSEGVEDEMGNAADVHAAGTDVDYVFRKTEPKGGVARLSGVGSDHQGLSCV